MASIAADIAAEQNPVATPTPAVVPTPVPVVTPPVAPKPETATPPPANPLPPAGKAAEPTPPAVPAVPAPDPNAWKKLPFKDILSNFGYDESVLPVLQHVKDGTVENWAKSYNTDFNTMSDMELRRMQIDVENPDLTPAQRTRMFERDKIKRGLTEDATDEERSDAEIDLKADMRPFRKQQIEQQQASRIAAYKEPAAAQAEAAQEMQQYIDNTVKTHAAYKELLEKGTLSTGTGDAAFNLNAKADSVLALLTNPDVEAKAYQDKDGNVDIRKHLQIATILEMGGLDAYTDMLYNHWNNTQDAGIVRQMRNEVRPGTSTANQPVEEDAADRAAAAMVKAQYGT